MPRFAKRHDCPSSETLRAATSARTLSPFLRAGVAAHLESCEFCGAESRLVARADELIVEPTPAPEMPLALRLFAESRLAEVASVAAFRNMRAA